MEERQEARGQAERQLPMDPYHPRIAQTPWITNQSKDSTEEAEKADAAGAQRAAGVAAAMEAARRGEVQRRQAVQARANEQHHDSDGDARQC